MAAVLWAFLRFAPTTNPWLLGGGGALAGLSSYLVATLLLRSPEPRFAWAAVRQRLGDEPVITIDATAVVGDGVPYNGDTTDQHWALVCSNCSSSPPATPTPSPTPVPSVPVPPP